MKKIILLFALTSIVFSAAAQNKAASPTEQALADTICKDLSKLDMKRITTKDEAVSAFTNCFLAHTDMLMKVAEEQHVDATDEAAMQKIGGQIGKDLMAMNCDAFIKISVKMVQDDKTAEGTGATSGVFKRIEQKGFNYVVLVENNSEKSFLWLREFPGSDKFFGDTAQYAGKKMEVSWREIEVYLPQAKGYYKVKEITGISLH